MNNQTTDNRRINQRSLISIAVRKRIGSDLHLCQASNISAQGMHLAHVSEGEPVPPGTKCWLEFSLPETPDMLIAVRGVVLRQTPYTKFMLSAVRFACIAPSHKRMIEDYVKGPPLATPVAPFIPLRLAG